MSSIRGKFLRLNLFSTLLCVLLIGGLGLWSISVIQKRSSQDLLSLTCRVEGQVLEADITSIRESVDLFSTMIDDNLPSLDTLRGQAFVNTFVADAERMMGQIAAVTHGVCAYYLRIDPGLTAKQEGFFYGKQPNGAIEKEPLTDLSAFDPSDVEHVGWYYQPQIAGRPIWMEPYFNQNLGVYMVSYVVPCYRDGVFWGICGMDIDFDVMIDRVRAISAYDTGYAFLCDLEGMIYYHPELELGSALSDHCGELDALLAAFADAENATERNTIHYRYNEINKSLSHFRLSNGMALVLSARDSEINAPLIALLRSVSLAAALICAVVTLLVIRVTNRIIRPLESLTQAAQKIEAGNLDVDLPAPGDDEVGILTRAFAATVSSLKKYVATMNNMAFTDPLTHVKNKTAYDRAVIGLQKDIAAGNARFAIVMIDLNNLKGINDRYGHERGDEYITRSCKLICEVFKHSPVYRIGGDEFVVLLTGESLTLRKKLLEQLNRGMRETFSIADPWARLSFAKGVAVYAPDDPTVEAVFVRADEAMYADKRRMKKGRDDVRG